MFLTMTPVVARSPGAPLLTIATFAVLAVVWFRADADALAGAAVMLALFASLTLALDVADWIERRYG